MNILNNTLKATWVATLLFWTMMSQEITDLGFIPYVFVSTILIFICCLLVILFTINPFFSIKRDKLENKEIFKKYFPYWAIIAFGICGYSIHYFRYQQFAISFFTTAFFTAMLVWAWSSKLIKDVPTHIKDQCL